MNAKEMFENLGYRIDKSSTNNDFIDYINAFGNIIKFDKRSGSIMCNSLLTLDFHKAIHRQLIEIGCIDESLNLSCDHDCKNCWKWSIIKQHLTMENDRLMSQVAELQRVCKLKEQIIEDYYQYMKEKENEIRYLEKLLSEVKKDE